MLDTMTLTKAVGALCAFWLVLLLGKWAADGLYHIEASDGHGEQAYVIATGDDDEPAEAVEEVPFDVVFASASADSGERLWRQCQACHALDGTDGVGPHLNGVVQRAKASVDGYDYSEAALAQQDQAWTPDNLSAFLESPRAYWPGTKMSYSGMGDVEDRANLIAYLATTAE